MKLREGTVPLPNIVVRTARLPSICLDEDDGSWVLELEDASLAVVLSTLQVRAIVDDFLSQQLGGPFEDGPGG